MCTTGKREQSVAGVRKERPPPKKLLYTVVEFQFSRGLFQIQLTAVHFLHRSKDRGQRSGNSLDFLKNSFGRSRIYFGQESQECVSRIQECHSQELENSLQECVNENSRTCEFDFKNVRILLTFSKVITVM